MSIERLLVLVGRVTGSLTCLRLRLTHRDEKTVLLSQISTLQGQQAALGSRLESLTNAADNGMSREREAEERLDAALTQHAHQIRQRQVSSFYSRVLKKITI